MQGVRLFVSDKCWGLVESLGEFYPEAMWQRCTVHFCHNVWRAVPTSKVREVAAMLKAIHAQEDRAAARQKAEQVAAKLKEMNWRTQQHWCLPGSKRRCSTTLFPPSTGDVYEPTTHWNAFCGKCDEERALSEHFRMGSRR